MRDEDWLPYAACTDRTDLDWFPRDEGGPGNHAEVVRVEQESRAVCLFECVVAFECVIAGEYDQFGIRGGFSGSERRKFRRRLEDRQLYDHHADRLRAKLGTLFVIGEAG